MASERISKLQLKALQTLYGKFEQHDIGDGAGPRVRRLRWAESVLGHKVESFSTLTGRDARVLMDTLKGTLGQPLDRQGGRAAGREGKRGFQSDPATLVGKWETEEIARRLTRLGWDQARLEAWLRSHSGPLRGRDRIRTKGDANRVLWGLKGLLKESGLWSVTSGQKGDGRRAPAGNTRSFDSRGETPAALAQDDSNKSAEGRA